MMRAWKEDEEKRRNESSLGSTSSGSSHEFSAVNKVTPSLSVEQLAFLVNVHAYNISKGVPCKYDNDYRRLVNTGTLSSDPCHKRQALTHIRNELTRAWFNEGNFSRLRELFDQDFNMFKGFLQGHCVSLDQARRIATAHGWYKFGALHGLDELFFVDTAAERMKAVKTVQKQERKQKDKVY